MMIRLAFKCFGGLILLILLSMQIEASECYESSTVSTYKIILKNTAIYFQFTQKDQNGFSYVKQQNKVLKGIDAISYKALGEDERTFMFGDKNGFYILPKLEQYDEHSATYFKILNASSNQRHINGRIFLINGKWTYLNAWGKEITRIVLDKLPRHISNIKCYSFGMYVKDDKNVFAISIDEASSTKYRVTVVPDLNPVTTVYYACNPLNNEDYLADANHFFSIDKNGSVTDLSPQLLALGLRNNINKLKLADKDLPFWYLDQKVLKKRDGVSTSGHNPLNGEEIDLYYSFSSAKILQPMYGKSAYAIFLDHVYPIWDDNFAEAYDVKTNVSQLRSIEGKLFCGNDFYYIEVDDHLKIISTSISAKAQFFPGIWSYHNFLPKALVDDKYIHFISDRFNINSENKKKLSSKIVKQLGMFYFFNHSLYDGKNTYTVHADEKTLNYLGSFVEIINGCSDETSINDVDVEYHQFFKDKNHIYYFNNQTHQLQTVQTADVDLYQQNNYDDLQALYKIKDVKGAVKTKSSWKPNYYLIVGCCFLVLGIGVYWLKRNK